MPRGSVSEVIKGGFFGAGLGLGTGALSASIGALCLDAARFSGFNAAEAAKLTAPGTGLVFAAVGAAGVASGFLPAVGEQITKNLIAAGTASAVPYVLIQVLGSSLGWALFDLAGTATMELGKTVSSTALGASASAFAAYYCYLAVLEVLERQKTVSDTAQVELVVEPVVEPEPQPQP